MATQIRPTTKQTWLDRLDEDPLARRMFACCAIIAGVLTIGTLGFMIIEGWELHESFYMTVITLSTVGFGETHDLSTHGRFFTTGLILISVIGLSCWTASLTSLLVEGDLSGGFRKKKAKKMAASLSKHTIVCGSGLMAKSVIDQLSRKQVPMVVIDNCPDGVDSIRNRYPSVPIIVASGVDDLALFDANVLAATHVVAASESDFDNLLIAMSCKDLGTDLKVVARTNDVRIASRMLKAGVDNVICPFQLSGEYAAELIVG